MGMKLTLWTLYTNRTNTWLHVYTYKPTNSAIIINFVAELLLGTLTNSFHFAGLNLSVLPVRGHFDFQCHIEVNFEVDHCLNIMLLYLIISQEWRPTKVTKLSIKSLIFIVKNWHRTLDGEQHTNKTDLLYIFVVSHNYAVLIFFEVPASARDELLDALFRERVPWTWATIRKVWHLRSRFLKRSRDSISLVSRRPWYEARIASSLSLIRFCIPICEANSESGSKQILSKCWLHKTLYSLGPLHWVLVLDLNTF